MVLVHALRVTIGTCCLSRKEASPWWLQVRLPFPRVELLHLLLHLKRKVLALGSIKLEVLTATPTSSLPVADVAKVMDTCCQAMRTTWLENGRRRNPPPQDLISLSAILLLSSLHSGGRKVEASSCH